MENIKYHPIELHSHTENSDGFMKSGELCENAKKFGYSGIFITDHNTMAAHYELEEKKIDIPVMRGIEWTTFYGHMLILGCKEAGDWTRVNKDGMDEAIVKIKDREDAVIGIAHPFAIGNPICTGCHWEFIIENWENIDFIEIFNSANPQDIFWNQESYEFWRKKLRQGYRIAASSGRDWHCVGKEDENIPLTYLGISDEITTETSVKAIKNGRLFVTLGPVITGELNQKENPINLGDEINDEELSIKLEIKKSPLKAYENFEITPKLLRVYNNDEIAIEKNVNYDEAMDFKVNPKKGFLYFEVTGSIKGKENSLLVVTSPIYVK